MTIHRPVALVLVAGFTLLAGRTAAAESYTIDGSHSSVVFRVKHMNVSNFYGRFNDISGKLNLDAANPEASSIEVTLKTESIDTANEKRDNHLKSPDFFNAKEFPTLTFKSTKVEAGEGETLKVTGDLTLHGVTKSITVDVEKTGTADHPRGGKVTGVASTFTIKRSEFGMDYMLSGLSDEVTIMIGLEGIAKN